MSQTFLRTNNPSLGLNPSHIEHDQIVNQIDRPLDRFQRIIQQAKYSGLNMDSLSDENFTSNKTPTKESCCRGDGFGSTLYILALILIGFALTFFILKPSK